MVWWWHCIYSNKLQETLRVEPCVEFELNLRESDLEPSLLISIFFPFSEAEINFFGT